MQKDKVSTSPSKIQQKFNQTEIQNNTRLSTLTDLSSFY